VLRGVPEEDALTGMWWGELMVSSGRGVWVAGAPEDTEMGVGRSGAEKGKVQGGS
jgi:hypothetical protein